MVLLVLPTVSEVVAHGNVWFDVLPQEVGAAQQLESRLGLALPELAKSLLEFCAGGVPLRNCLEPAGISVEALLHPLNRSYALGVVPVRELWTKEWSLNPNLVPFAHDGCGNFFAVDVSDQHVSYILHDGCPSERLEVTLNEFISGLQFDPDETPEDRELRLPARDAERFLASCPSCSWSATGSEYWCCGRCDAPLDVEHDGSHCRHCDVSLAVRCPRCRKEDSMESWRRAGGACR